MAFHWASSTISAYAKRSPETGSRKIEYFCTPCATRASVSSCQIGLCRRSYSCTRPGCTDMRNALRIMRTSYDARAQPNGGRSLGGSGLAVAAGAEDRNRIDRPAGALPRDGQNRRDVGRKRLFQCLQRHERIVLLLIGRERPAVHEAGLHVRAHQLDGARDQRLDWIG